MNRMKRNILLLALWSISPLWGMKRVSENLSVKNSAKKVYIKKPETLCLIAKDGQKFTVSKKIALESGAIKKSYENNQFMENNKEIVTDLDANVLSKVAEFMNYRSKYPSRLRIELFNDFSQERAGSLDPLRIIAAGSELNYRLLMEYGSYAVLKPLLQNNHEDTDLVAIKIETISNIFEQKLSCSAAALKAFRFVNAMLMVSRLDAQSQNKSIEDMHQEDIQNLSVLLGDWPITIQDLYEYNPDFPFTSTYLKVNPEDAKLKCFIQPGKDIVYQNIYMLDLKNLGLVTSLEGIENILSKEQRNAISMLQLTGNRFTHLTPALVKEFPNVSAIALSRNPIRHISGDLAITTIKSLALCEVSLPKLTANSLSWLPNLRRLNLSFNPDLVLKKNVWKAVPDLRILDLEDIESESAFATDEWKKLCSLRYLNLKGTGVSTETVKKIKNFFNCEYPEAAKKEFFNQRYGGQIGAACKKKLLKKLAKRAETEFTLISDYSELSDDHHLIPEESIEEDAFTEAVE